MALRVLMSFTPDRGDISVNPYTALLEQSLATRCSVERFTWPVALRGGYQVLHCHWPEHLIGNRRWHRRTVAQVLFAVLLVLLRVRRVVIVQTMHNENPHSSPSRISNILLGRLEAMVDVRIALHASPGAQHVFLHGDYRRWYAERPKHDPVPGRLAYFGRVAPYKNVDGLIAAFAQLADPTLTLVVAGSAADTDLEARIRALARPDDRVELRLAALSDDELSRTITGAEAVVLPYGYLYNSGALLLALSLGCPVIAPRADLTDALSDEVGPQWVARYEQPLDGPRLGSALAELRRRRDDRVAPPTFVGRDWDEQAARLVTVYRDAVAARRG